MRAAVYGGVARFGQRRMKFRGGCAEAVSGSYDVLD